MSQHLRFPPVFAIILFGFGLIFSGLVYSEDSIPYSTRTHGYNVWPSTVRGDIRTVGMAGATTGHADTFVASLDNPAGLAMTLLGANSSYVSDFVSDAYVQNASAPLNSYHVGLAWNHHPWGFSVGYSTPYYEGQTYLLPSTPSDPTELSISLAQFHFSMARLLFHQRLSVGAGLSLGNVSEQIRFSQNTGFNHTVSGFGVRGNIGVLAHLHKRLLLGLSFHSPVRYEISPVFNTSPGLPGFFQPAELPPQLRLGLGWLPNRFFKADFTLLAVGISRGAALLRNDAISVGQTITLQPHLGISYVFSDYKELRGTLFLGSYYESSRIQGFDNRLHWTAGVEVNPWIFFIGTAVDRSLGYQNYLLFLGVDIMKTLKKFDIIPQEDRPPSHGFFPNPSTYSEDGLPRALVTNWVKPSIEIDPIQVGLSAPGKIEAKMREVGQQVREAFETSKEEEPKPKHVPKHHSGTHHKKALKKPSKKRPASRH